MQLKSFVRKPLYINAVQVTEENMEEVAEYFAEEGARIEVEDDGTRYIKIDVKIIVNRRLTMAKAGDWVTMSTVPVVRKGVVETKRSLRVFLDKAFKKEFETTTEPANPDQDQLDISVPMTVGASE